MNSRNRKILFNFIVPIVGAVSVALPIALTQNFTDSNIALGVAVVIGFVLAYANGRMLGALWNTINENRVRFIGVYPISFIESDTMRRTLLVVLTPFIVLCNAIWYFLPIATGLKHLIFTDGFWEANASALVTTWRRQVTVSDLAMADYGSYDRPEFPEDDVFRVDD